MSNRVHTGTDIRELGPRNVIKTQSTPWTVGINRAVIPNSPVKNWNILPARLIIYKLHLLLRFLDVLSLRLYYCLTNLARDTETH